MVGDCTLNVGKLGLARSFSAHPTLPYVYERIGFFLTATENPSCTSLVISKNRMVL